MIIYTDLEYKILELIRQYNITSTLSDRLSFGGGPGEGGGSGGPITTPIGQLPQKYICFDTSELATTWIPASGQSLLDNLNRIRSGLVIVPSGYIPINFTVTGDKNLYDYLEGIDNALGDSPAGADPTSYITTTVYVGAATTFMRSDATPALDQGIEPTWSGHHLFQPTTDADDVLRVNDNAGDIVFTVDTINGWVGVGVVPSGIFHVLQTGPDDAFFDMVDDASEGFNFNFRFARGSPGSEEVVQDDDVLGKVVFKGYSAIGGEYKEAAFIQGRVDGPPDSGDPTDMPGALDFYTTPDGGASALHSATITENACFGVDTKTPGKDIVGGGADIGGRVMHIKTTGDGRLLGEGTTGGYLNLIHTNGDADDKIVEFALLGGELIIRSLNDDLSVNVDNTLKIDLGTGLTTLLTLALSTGGGTTVNKISTDGTLATNSDDFIVTEKAIKTYVDGHVPAGSGHVIRDDVPVDYPHRSFLQFLDAGSVVVTVADNAGDDETEVTISGTGAGHTIRDSDEDFTQRTGLQFLGDVIVTDDAGDDETVVTFVAISSGTAMRTNIDATPAPDGVETEFTVTTGSYTGSTLIVSVNGQVQTLGSDFTETVPSDGTFTFLAGSTPQTDDIIKTFFGLPAADANLEMAMNKTCWPLPDGIETEFTVYGSGYTAETLMVTINGLTQTALIDFVETTPANGTFTFQAGHIPITDDAIRVFHGLASSAGVGGVGTVGVVPKWVDTDTLGDSLISDDGSTVKIGTDPNYTSIASDGEIGLHGTARVINAIWVDAGGIKSPGAHPATEIAQGVLETPAWQFADQGVAANQESISFNVKIPYRMDRSIAPTISIGWSADGVSPGDCRWSLEYLWREEDEDTTIAAQAVLAITTPASATSNGLVFVEFPGLVLPSALDVCTHCRITRLSASGVDTIGDTTELHGVCYKWTSNKLGTAT